MNDINKKQALNTSLYAWNFSILKDITSNRLVSFRQIIGVFALFLTSLYAHASTPLPDASVWSVSGQKIMYQVTQAGTKGSKSQFQGKGIIYEPMPIGFSAATTYGDIYHSEWRTLYMRDIPILRKMGVNVIRIYGFFGYPPTDGTDTSLSANLQNTLKDNYTNCIDSTNAKPLPNQTTCTKYWDTAPWDHSEFFDLLWNDGVDPIYVMVGIENESIGNFLSSDNAQPTNGTSGYLGYMNYINFYNNQIAWIGRKYGNKPALLGFAMFNETNDGRWTSDSYWSLINGFAAQVKTHMPDKIVGLALQTSAADVNDKSKMSSTNVLNSTVDFWGVNLYPIANYGSEYKTYVENNSSAKPVMISEYGQLSVQHNPSMTSGWPTCTSSCPTGTISKVNEQAAGSDLKSNYNKAFNTKYPFFNALFYFAYSDEWWKMTKSGNSSTINTENTKHLWIQDMGIASVSDTPSGYWDEEWWGMYAAQRSGYDVNVSSYIQDYSSDMTNYPSWIQYATYYKTPLDYLIPRSPQLTELVKLYSGNTLSDLPLQNAFTLSHQAADTASITALYGYEASPKKTYLANYAIAFGKTATIATPANVSSFIVYDSSWIPMCPDISEKLGNNQGGTLYVTGSKGNYKCSFTAP